MASLDAHRLSPAFIGKNLTSFLTAGIKGEALPKKSVTFATISKLSGWREKERLIRKVYVGYEGMHSLKLFLEDFKVLDKGASFEGMKTLEIQLFNNVSPCRICSESLCEFLEASQKKKKEQEKSIKIHIKFGRVETEDERDMEGLKKLQSKGVKLSTMTAYEWVQLLLEDRSILTSEDWIKKREEADEVAKESLQQILQSK